MTYPFRFTGLPAILSLLLTLAFASIPGQAQPAVPGPGPRTGSALVTAYVVLEGEPVVGAPDGPRSPRALAGRQAPTLAYARQLEARQTALQPQLAALGARVTARFTRLANAVRVLVPADQLDRLASLPGVRHVHQARLYSRLLSTSVPFVGAPALWKPTFTNAVPGSTGKGIRIGIIDSGIDYHHADFGGSGRVEDYRADDPTRLEPGSFPTAKVVGGFDFAGDSYDAGDENHETPVPDPDPLDCAGNGHGTHVAGIAAGFGVLPDGQTFRGDYATLSDFTKFSVGPGVAPEAQLYALKVFGCGGSTALVTEALEWAADPNGDYDFSDHLDVVNLSLGGEFGALDPEDTDVAAANRLAQLGCVVVCAAGNGDNIFYGISAPGVAARAIAVANSITKGEGKAIQVTSPAAVAGKYYMIEGGITTPLEDSGPVTGRLVQALPNRGCSAFSNAAEIRGNIALIDRGDCFFSVKILAAQTAGAIAVVMVNNLGGSPIVMGGAGDGIHLPGVMISRDDGDRLKAELKNGVNVRLDTLATVPRAEFVDTLDDSSSRGPGSPGNGLKPDLAAPGNSVHSADVASGSGGVTFSGTSMASPAVAGAAALLRQRHPDWSVEDVKAALMNTAKPIFDAAGHPYPESRAGAGRIQLEPAASAPASITADSGDGAVGLSFGALVLASPYQATRAARLTNHTDQPLTYRVSFTNSVAQSGATYQPTTNSITVPARGTAAVTLRFTADPALFEDTPDATTLPIIGAGTPLPRQFVYEASGQLWFTADQGSLHLPCYANVRAAADYRLAENRIVLPARASTNAAPEFTLRFLGSQASDKFFPLVSAFQLGDTSPDRHIADANRAAADLLAVGTATDLASVDTFEDSTVFFGLATSGPFTSPQPFLTQFLVLIDVNHDHQEDFAVYNGNGASTNTSGAADAFMSILLELDEKSDVVSTNAVGFLNHYAADEAETVPFNNSVLVLPVPVADLGLTEKNSRFDYKILTFTLSGSVDRTGWIPYDAAHPILDASFGSSDGSPMNDDGIPLPVRVDRAAAARAGQRLPRLLLLHHFGLPGKRMEIVTVDLANDDTDGDTLPDWWEQKYFSSLTKANATTDSDGDGAPDRHELLADTDPTNDKSSFRLKSATRTSPSNIAVRWSGIADQIYTLERSTDLGSDTWEVVRDDIESTPPLNSITDTKATGNGPFFYRVRLKN